MEIPARKFVKLLVEQDPASPEFRESVRAVVRDISTARITGLEHNLWKDVFVEQRLPWTRFAESALLHACALVLVWMITLVWLRQQKILAPTAFDRSSVITYSPEENLPPLDTGGTTAKPRVGDPVFAKQPILSVPREADNRSQTIVAPPELELKHDVPLPNIVAMGAVAPTVPLNAISSLSRRNPKMTDDVVAPTPNVSNSRSRAEQNSPKAQIVPPPPEVKSDRGRGLAGPETAVIAAPPELTANKGRVGTIDIAPSTAVAPAPQLAVAEQHALYGRGQRGKDSVAGSAQPVAPAPSLPGGGGGSGASGRLVALGIHPVTPTGPVAVPEGNRRGSFGAGPQGKRGAAGTPSSTGMRASLDGGGAKGKNGSLPAGLHVGAASGAVDSVAQRGVAGGDDARSGANRAATAGRLKATTISDDKMNDLDRQVFGERRPYGTTLNMPNLNSSTGSWVMHFAELEPDPKQSDLLQPLPMEKSDPGYPLELMKENVHGTVTVYAVIHADGKVDGIRVLSSPDDRLDEWATSALAGWKFLPALRAGKAVPVEAVVQIPFRVKKF